jgi:hypothetical protein
LKQAALGTAESATSLHALGEVGEVTLEGFAGDLGWKIVHAPVRTSTRGKGDEVGHLEHLLYTCSITKPGAGCGSMQ